MKNIDTYDRFVCTCQKYIRNSKVSVFSLSIKTWQTQFRFIIIFSKFEKIWSDYNKA